MVLPPLMVLGAGKLGAACTLALLSTHGTTHPSLTSFAFGSHRRVVLLSRQRALIHQLWDRPCSSGSASSSQRMLRLSPVLSVHWPRALPVEVQDYSTYVTQLQKAVATPTRHDASEPEAAKEQECAAATAGHSGHSGQPPTPLPPCCCVCVPLGALLRPRDCAAECPDAVTVLEAWWRAHRQGSTNPRRSSAVPMLMLFTRGFTAEGSPAAEVLLDRWGHAEEEEGEGPVVLTVCGPVLAEEWAQQSAVEKTPACRESAFSGTSWTVTVAHPPHPSSALRDQLEAQVAACFPRENITWCHDPDDTALLRLPFNVAARVMGVVNGCLPLIMFGAGLVQAAYGPTGPTTALLSYTQNVLQETTALTQAAVTPQNNEASRLELPPGAVAAITLACLHHSAKEFTLGKQLSFHFRKEEALRAVFQKVTGATLETGSEVGGSHTLESSAAGIHALLTAVQCDSPLYEGILDAFHTFVRAAVVGEGLVKAGYDRYREPIESSKPTLLQEIRSVDEALIHGSEEELKLASQHLADTFSAVQLDRRTDGESTS